MHSTMKHIVVKEDEQRRGPWLEEEDDQLAAAVALFGDRRWDALAKASGLRRNGKSCRLRWMNYLRPNLKHGNISPEEEQLILQLHHKWGNRWSKIARRLPGRTDNEIKNYWRSYSKKNAPLPENESLSSTTNTSSRSQCGTMSPSPIKNDDGSCDAMCITRSPYEARLTEWMSNWPPDTKDNVFNCNLYNPEWIPDDCIDSTWNISLWDGE